MKRFVFVFFKHKALCATPEEAIAFVDGLPGLECNRNTESFIRALYETDVPNAKDTNIINNMVTVQRDGLTHYIYAKSNTVRTTGCGRSSISIHPALADTLEEHERIYQQQKAERHERERARHEAYVQAQLDALNEQRRGWYEVELTYQQAYFHSNDGIRWRWKTFLGEVIADSGQDAYDKAIEHLTNNIENLPDSRYPDELSNDFCFTFLGMKTDDGFSVEAWEEYMRGENSLN